MRSKLRILFLFLLAFCCLDFDGQTAKGAVNDSLFGGDSALDDFQSDYQSDPETAEQPPIGQNGIGQGPPHGAPPAGQNGRPPGRRGDRRPTVAPAMSPGFSEQSLSQSEEPQLPTSRAIPDSLRSLADQNNPFYALQFSSDPVDPDSIVSGEPLTIYEMLENVSSPHNRTQLLRAYWELTGEIAKYKVAIQKRAELNKWSNGVETTHLKYPVLQAAMNLAYSQQYSQELVVQKKQATLAALMKRTGAVRPITLASQNASTTLVNPIPVDLPFIGEYKTKVNQLVHYKVTGADLIEMDKLIKIQRQLMESRLRELVAADEFFKQVQKTQGSVEAWIFAHDRYLTAYNSYVDSIIDYNLLIADYIKETVGSEIVARPLLTTIIQLNPLPAAAPLRSAETVTENPADTVPIVE